MLTQKVFGLPSVTDVVKGLLLQMGQRWDESEAAVCSRFIRNNKIFSSVCHIVCSNICCCSVVSIAFYPYFPQPLSNNCICICSILDLGSATCSAWLGVQVV